MTGFTIDEDQYLQHYGIKRQSGRYPWGSGEDNLTRSRDFLGMVESLRKQGMSDTDIARSFSTEEFPFTTTQLRATTTIARNEKRAAEIGMAQRLKAKGLSNGAIAERMGLAGESSVRALLDPQAEARTSELTNLSNMLRDEVNDKGYLDVGVGVERYTGSSRTQFDTALSMLESEGHPVFNAQIDQLTGSGQKTTVRVLGPKDLTEKEAYREVVMDNSKIKQLGVTQNQEGKLVREPPILNFDSKRLGVRYAEDGGTDADGVIYVRPGVKDVSLGGAQYAQVRIGVDGTHYLKGMAVYKDDLPPGVDLQFNTNKSDTGNKLDALKKMKDDPEDPFGAVTKPILNADGTARTSVMNVVNSEGDWSHWSKNLATQMLSKQKPLLAKEQLDKTYSDKKKEFDEISSLTNPAVKKKLLESYADGVDSASVHLKAAALPRQATQVILPVSNLKPTEVYAPNFRDGERVALVRFPHGGTFEIPELTVNNRNPDAIALLGRAAKDAIGIHPKVAEQLSGADFDGDTVIVIPNNSGKVKSKPPLQQLKDFDPKRDYAPFDGMKTIDGGQYNAATKSVDYGTKNPSGKLKQTEMGKVSNLITDMTIKGATDAEIARAVKHSMVVIDAEKHHLNYKQSAKDNNISQLKEKYQGVSEKGQPKGASTLISRTSSQEKVPQRKMGYRIDPDTGERIFTETGAGYTNKAGKWVALTSNSTKGAEAKDAHSLSSGTPVEEIYADHSNRLKVLANEARKEYVSTKSIPYSPSAKQIYSNEVSTLNAKLNVALKNAPQERQAQLVANARVKQKVADNPGMEKDELKKLKGKALVDARIQVGAGKTMVDITDREWEAIQAGAISNDKLEKILNNTDLDRVKELATPRQATVMTSAKQTQARQLLSSGRTPSEVADILGVPVSTLTSSMEGE